MKNSTMGKKLNVGNDPKLQRQQQMEIADFSCILAL
jgi:hypothetical protein